MNRYVVGLAASAVCCNVGGNYLLSRGMRDLGPLVSASPLAYLRAVAHPMVLAGVVVLVCWLVAQLSLLSWADLTFVLPITALGYVLTAILGALSLGEHVSLSRWAGVILITAGVAVVSRTRARTAPVPKAEPPL
jgi:multidrug transporter EmrE-like cation transporter